MGKMRAPAYNLGILPMRMLAFLVIALIAETIRSQNLDPKLQARLPAAQSVTGEQVEQILAAAHGKPDSAVAKQIHSLEPAIRIGPAAINRCQAYLSGPKTEQAFTALVDWSVFLRPPANEIPALAIPNVPAQKQMLTLTTE